MLNPNNNPIHHNNANSFNWAYQQYLDGQTFENYQMAKFYLQQLERSQIEPLQTKYKYTQVMKRFFDLETPPSQTIRNTAFLDDPPDSQHMLWEIQTRIQRFEGLQSQRLQTTSEEPNEAVPSQLTASSPVSTRAYSSASTRVYTPGIFPNPGEVQPPKITFVFKTGFFFNDHKRGFMLKVGPEFKTKESFLFVKPKEQLKFYLYFTLGAQNPIPTHSGVYFGGQLKAYGCFGDYTFYCPNNKNYTVYHQTLIRPNFVTPRAIFVNRFGYQYISSLKTKINNTIISPSRSSLVYSPQVSFLGFKGEGGGEIETRQLCFDKTLLISNPSPQCNTEVALLTSPSKVALVSSSSSALPKPTQSSSWFGAGFLTIGVFLGGISFYVWDKIRRSSGVPKFPPL